MFGKVFRSLWEGSLCGKPDDQLVFVFMLASADADGVVDVVPSIISHQTGLAMERVAGAIARLMEPDPESRTTDHEGRRLLAVGERSWGWKIVNYKKYRAMRDDRERREQNNRAQAKRRGQPLSAGVSQGQPQSAQVEVEVEVEVEVDGEVEAEESKDSSLRSVSENGVSKRRKKTPTTNREVDREWLETFDEVWWPEYLGLGRKCSRAAAREVWAKIPHLDGQADFDRLNGEWESARASWTEERRETRYIPHAEVWLRDYLKNLALEAS